jgi:glycosyltransferase involved in cell wall biosynthesis
MGLLYDFTGLKELSLDMANTLNSCNIKLLTVGKGDLWNTLQSIKKEFKLENRIITLEWKQYEELPKYLAAADICILPALNNPIMKNIVPIKMYEYMAAKKPVISTALPGIMKEFGLDKDVLEELIKEKRK